MAYIVFRAGFGVEARLVRQKNKGVWTHVGLLVDGAFFESIADTDEYPGGVVKSALACFCNAGNAHRVAHLPFFLETQPRRSLRAWCENLAARRLPFDTTYDLSTDDKMYCSEFVYKAFLHIGIVLCNGPFTQLTVPFSGVKQIIFPFDLIGNRQMKEGLPVNKSGNDVALI